VLGCDTPAAYAEAPPYLGATVGRFANRIAGGRFALNGKTYQLETNDGPNHLHGGVRGLDKVVWTIESVSGGATSGDDASTASFSYVSADGEGGYPGELRVTATFSLTAWNELAIVYKAATTKPTVVNITNHNFYNLAGERAATDTHDQLLTIFANAYLPVDATLIPTSETRPLAGTAFDFRTPRRIGDGVRGRADEQIRIALGYDHTFVIDGPPDELRPTARLWDPGSGRMMEILSTAPGLQFYSGNFLNGKAGGRRGRLYRQGDGICLEPQALPNSPNTPAFPSTRLNPGETYVNRMLLRFSIALPASR
jgi:aldose 1-epimerase